MNPSFAFRMSSYPASLQACLQALEDSEVYDRMPAPLRFAAELILDELASNTIKYGGLACREISVNLTWDGHVMQLTLTDDALPFDPRPRAQTPLMDSGPIAGLTVGGRGLQMLREVIDHWHYERRDDRNINILTRSLDRNTHPAAA